MIFVTVGSQKFQFNRLVKAIDDLAVSELKEEDIYVQTGHSTYIPKNCSSAPFLSRTQFFSYISQSDVVITHGGTGAIIGALKQGKRVLAIPRLSKYGEHVDDHQIEIVRQFAKMHLIEPCFNVEDILNSYLRCLINKYSKYESNSNRFMNDLDSYLCKL